MYTVDAETGEIIHRSTLPVNLSQFRVSMTEDPSIPSQLPSGTETKEEKTKFNYITIIRTDYTVSCFDISKTLWNWTMSFFTAYYPNGNRYILKQPSHTGDTIPIQFKGKELLLARTFDENTHSTDKFKPLQLDLSRDENRALKDSINGLVLGSAYPIHGNRNGLVMPERSFKITDTKNNFTSLQRLGSVYSGIVLLFLCFIQIVMMLWPRWLKETGKKEKQTSESNAHQNGVSKKKKSRRNGADGSPGNTQDGGSGDGEKPPPLVSKFKEELWPDMQNAELNEGKWVGKLFVSSKEIGRGSNGTVVLKGVYDGRPVAVKRLLHAHHNVALKEIRNLIASDQHPNIVRLYGVEQDADFVYISLERCDCSLADLILFSSGVGSADIRVRWSVSGQETDKDVVLWRENGFPSPQLLKLMRFMT
jgi:serine/threonine-protein kinase/endoribonuclease IRE1